MRAARTCWSPPQSAAPLNFRSPSPSATRLPRHKRHRPPEPSATTRPRKPRAEKSDLPADYLRDLTDRLHRHFGTAVRLTAVRTLANGKKTPGTLAVDFYDNDDLDRLLTLLGLSESP